jgi:hypothetical protein
VRLQTGDMLVSKVIVPLPEFPFTKFQGERDDDFLARVELGAENVIDSYDCVEHDACVLALPNGGRLNRVFGKVGVTYGPRSRAWF